jgi:hypothetical protein
MRFSHIRSRDHSRIRLIPFSFPTTGTAIQLGNAKRRLGLLILRGTEAALRDVLRALQFVFQEAGMV